MTDDQFKRASLKGKGWQIFQGKDQPTSDTGAEDDENMQLGNVSITPDEANDLFAIAPEPLAATHDTGSMTPIAPSEPPAVDITLPNNEDFQTARQLTPSPDMDIMDLPEQPIDLGTLDRIPSKEAQSMMGSVNTTMKSAYTTIELKGEAIPQLEDLPEAPHAFDLSGIDRPVNANVQAITPKKAEIGQSSLGEMGGQQNMQSDFIDTDMDGIPDFATHNIPDSTLKNRATETTPNYTNLSEGETIVSSEELQEKANFMPSDHFQDTMDPVQALHPIAPETIDDFAFQRQMEGNSGSGGIFGAEMLAAAARAADSAIEEDSTFFDKNAQRADAQALFGKPRTGDPLLVDKLIDNKRIMALWNQIEELQEGLVDSFYSNRAVIDVYQHELHEASNLLLESRQNYDDARAIVNRVRADISRDKRIRELISEYRPRIFAYLIFASVVVFLLGIAHGYVEELASDFGIPFLGEAHLPAVFGAGGGLLIAYLTLDKHTTRRLDFDPIHIPWYFSSPVIGALMGFMMFLLITASIATTVTQNITTPEALRDWPVVIWLLAFVAGMQQNFVLNFLKKDDNKEMEASTKG